MPKKKGKQNTNENERRLVNSPYPGEAREWWKYTASPTPYYSPNYVVASPSHSKKTSDLKQSLSMLIETTLEEELQLVEANALSPPNELDVYFDALVKSLDITPNDIERMQLTTDEKWNLIHSYNQIVVLQQPEALTVPADILTYQEKNQDITKKNLKLIKLLSNKKKAHKTAPVLQQMMSVQYIQCIGILLQRKSTAREPTRRGRSAIVPTKPSVSDSDALLLLLQGLRVSLSSKPVQWLKDFIQQEGLKYVISTLSYVHSSSFPSSLFPQIQFEALKCLNLCLNHYMGLEKLVEDYTQCLSCIQQLVFGLSTTLSSSKAVSAKLLAVFASLDAQRAMVISALTQTAKLRNEPSRFFRLVMLLNEDSSLQVKVNSMVLINALVYDTESREKIFITSELEQLGIQSSLSMLENSFPQDENQKLIKILHTQIAQLRGFLYQESYEEEEGQDSCLVFDFHPSDDILEHTKRRLQSETNKNNELSTQIEELQSAYYNLHNENQSFRILKERATAELAELRQELCRIQEQMIDMAQMAHHTPRPLPRSEKNQQQSFTDIFLQFGEQFSDSTKEIHPQGSKESLQLKYCQLETVNGFLQEKQLSMEQKIRILQQESVQAEETIQQLNQKNEELSLNISSLRESHEEEAQRTEKLMTTLNQDKSKCQQENIVLKSQLNALEELANGHALDLEKSNAKVKRQEETIQQLQRQLCVASQQYESLKQQNDRIQQQNETQLDSIASANEQVIILRETIETHSETITVLSGTITNLRKDSEKTQNEHSSEVAILRGQIEHEKLVNQALQRSVTESSRANEELMDEYNDSLRKIDILQESIICTENELALVNQQLTRVLKEEKEPLEQEFQALQSRYQLSEHSCQRLSNEVEFTRTRLRDIEETHRKVLSEYKLSCTSVEEITVEKEKLLSDFERLSYQLKEQQQINQSLESQLQELSVTLCSNHAEKQQLERLRNEFTDKMNLLTVQLNETQEERKQLMEQNNRTQENLEIIQREMEILADAKKKLDEEQQELDSLKEQFAREKRNVQEQLALRAVELNTQQENQMNQLMNFKNAKNQFNQEIANFLSAKQQQQKRLEEKTLFLNEQIKEVEQQMEIFTQEKEAFACFQLAEQKKTQELQHANNTLQEEITALRNTSQPAAPEKMKASNSVEISSPICGASGVEFSTDDKVACVVDEEPKCTEAIPIPPPPPGMGKADLNLPEPEGCNVVPSVKLKALNWKKITPTVFSHSIWSEIPTPSLEIPVEQLEQLFQANSASCTKKKGLTKPSKGNITVIDPRRAQNVAILLSSSKCSSQSICNAIKQMNTNFFDDSLLAQLQKNTPTSDEIEIIQQTIQENTNANLLLGPAESFFLQISEISHYQDRLQLLSLVQTYSVKYLDISKQIERVRSALSDIENAKYFPVMMKILLSFGNFFNHGCARGRAYGFKLSSLDSLVQMRTTSSKAEERTFLHIFSSFMGEKFPEVESGFMSELASVIEAAAECPNEIEAAIRMLNTEIQRGTLLLQELSSEEIQSLEAIQVFLSDALQQTNDLKQQGKDANAKLADLARFYAFSPQEASMIKFEEFFQYFGRFCASYMDVKKEIVLIYKREEDSKRREAAAKDRKDRIAKKKIERQVKQREDKMVDNLFEDLCGGNYKSERRNSTSKRMSRRIPVPSKQAASSQMKEEIIDIWNNCVIQKKRRRTKTPVFRPTAIPT